MRSYLPWLVGALAFLLWRNGRGWRNTLALPDYPLSYYYAGDSNTHCNVVREKDMRFCEDAVFWDLLDAAGNLKERKLLLSCDPNRPNWNTVMGPLRDPQPRGSLWVYAPGDMAHQARPQRMSLVGYPRGHEFHPLGLDVWPSHAGNASHLFVVNHARVQTVIEQFLLDPSDPAAARWVRTLSHARFVSPNALALTSPTSFYVTNDHLMTRRLPSPLGNILPITESLLALPLGWLAHVSIEPESEPPGAPPSDGPRPVTLKHTIVQFGVPFANGVALSPDRAQLALASTTLQHVDFYARDPYTHALTHMHTVPLPFSVDNVRYDDDGALIVAGHPNFLSLIRVAAGKDTVAPSWAMAVSPRKSGARVGSYEHDPEAPVSAASRVPPVPSHEIQTLYQSNGTGFSASSTVLRDTTTGTLYMTGLYEEGLLTCHP